MAGRIGGGEGGESLVRQRGRRHGSLSRYCAPENVAIYSRPAPIACARGYSVDSSRKEFLHNAVLTAASPSLVSLAEPALSRGKLTSPFIVAAHPTSSYPIARRQSSPAAAPRRASGSLGTRPVIARRTRAALAGDASSGSADHRSRAVTLQRGATHARSVDQSLGSGTTIDARCSRSISTRWMPVVLKIQHFNFTGAYLSL